MSRRSSPRASRGRERNRRPSGKTAAETTKGDKFNFSKCQKSSQTRRGCCLAESGGCGRSADFLVAKVADAIDWAPARRFSSVNHASSIVEAAHTRAAPDRRSRSAWRSRKKNRIDGFGYGRREEMGSGLAMRGLDLGRVIEGTPTAPDSRTSRPHPAPPQPRTARTAAYPPFCRVQRPRQVQLPRAFGHFRRTGPPAASARQSTHRRSICAHPPFGSYAASSPISHWSTSSFAANQP